MNNERMSVALSIISEIDGEVSGSIYGVLVMIAQQQQKKKMMMMKESVARMQVIDYGAPMSSLMSDSD